MVLVRGRVWVDVSSRAHFSPVGKVTNMVPPAGTASPNVMVIIMLPVVLTVVGLKVTVKAWKVPGSSVTLPVEMLAE